jgi:tetratricopeptide (TPR) repeat protein
LKIIVFLFPIILFLLFLFIKLLFPDTYVLITEEDYVVENGQFLFYFISSILSLFVSIKLIKNKLTVHGVLYVILSIGLFFIAMEEISWGQRIFNITTPDLFSKHNRQYEMNIHNMDVIGKSLLNKAYILLGAYGAFAWLFVRTFMLRAKTKCEHIINFVVPDWYVSSYFFFVFLIYIFLDFMNPYPGGFLLWKDQEPAELSLALGFFSFVIDNYIKLHICPAPATSVRHLRKSGFTMKMLSARQLLITLVPSVSILAALVVANVFFQVGIPSMTQDVAFIAKIHPLVGILSNLGILLWCATASICFFAAITLHNIKQIDTFRFFLFSAVLSTYLLFDDFFQIHEYLAPHYLGLNEKVITAALGIALAAYLIAFRRIILRTNFIILASAIVFFAVSIVVDNIFHVLLSQLIGYEWKVFIEDGTKWLGIACWCSYHVYTAYHFLVSKIGMSDNAIQSDAHDSKSGIINQDKINADSVEEQIKLKEIWNAYRAYIISILIILVAAGTLFSISQTVKSNKSRHQISNTESPKVALSASGESVSANDLFNNAYSLCSSSKCTDPLTAIKYLNEAIKLNPDFAAAYGMRGNVYNRLGQFQLAINDYNEVIRLSPDDVKAYVNRGSAYLMHGNKTLCCSDAQKACELGNCTLLDRAKRMGYCR